jgi:1-acyl-sn-glycerol-3-phosphate acyltransferase
MKNKLTLSVIIRSTLLWVIMIGVIPIYFLMAMLLLLIGNKKLSHAVLITWGKLFTYLCKYICNVDYQIIGYDNIASVKQPALFASNHQSTWETMAFNLILPKHVWVLKRELLNIPIFGWGFRTMSPIGINRDDKGVAIRYILEQGYKRLKSGFWIMIFPEGTRIPPNTDSEYKSGVARMSINLKVPVIPIGHNAGYIMPKSSFWVYPGLVTIRIGKAIYPNANESHEELILRIKQNILQLINMIDNSKR